MERLSLWPRKKNHYLFFNLLNKTIKPSLEPTIRHPQRHAPNHRHRAHSGHCVDLFGGGGGRDPGSVRLYWSVWVILNVFQMQNLILQMQ